MNSYRQRKKPGNVRDAIVATLAESPKPLSIREIEENVARMIGDTPSSSVRSYLRLNTPETFVRESHGVYKLSSSVLQSELCLQTNWKKPFSFGRATMYHADCFEWLKIQPEASLHAVVTDPPYGLHEYTEEQQHKLRNGKGGVWRIPPSFDGHKRSPLPRFTTLSSDQLEEIRVFFALWGKLLLPKLVPGANVIVAANPLLSYIVSGALADAGLERRGEIIRLTMTMRGGDRPKHAHKEYAGVSVMPRSMWEPWVLFRRPIEGRVQDNLRKWKTGGFRRPEADKPFGDVISSSPTRKQERAISPHPSLKPQSFLRQIMHAVLPLGEGIVCDPFAGSGSSLAAAEAVGYKSVGVEKDEQYFELAVKAIPQLAAL